MSWRDRLFPEGASRAATVWWAALAGYVWLLPVGGTTAGRNVALATLLAATAVRVYHGEIAPRLPLALPWLAYGAVAVLSLATATDPAYSLGEVRVEILYGLLAFFVAASGLRRAADAGRLAAVVIAGNGLLVAWNLATGMAGGSTKDGLVGTINTGAGNFSTYIVTVLPVIAATAWWLWREGRRRPAAALLALVLANGLALQFTLNRQAFLALLAELAVVGLWLLARQFSWRRAVALLALAVALCAVLAWQIEKRARAGHGTALVQVIRDDPRWAAWGDILAEIGSHPWTGSGFGQRSLPASLRVEEAAIWHAHNLVLGKGVQMGVPGIAVFLWLFAAVPWRLRRRLAGGGLDGLAALAGLAMAAGVFTKNMTDDFFLRGEGYLFWILAGALLGLTAARAAAGGRRFLVIRRDNIGDLVCTTPLLRALRARFPRARIDALVNSYNRPVLEGNPDLDHVYAYTKAKHRAAGESVAGVHLRRLRLMLALRCTDYDTAIVVNGGHLARWVAPRSIIGFEPPWRPARDRQVPADGTGGHEVERTFGLARALGIDGAPPALRLVPDAAERTRAQDLLAARPWYRADRPTVGVHISARKARQRWPAERFAALMRELHGEAPCQFLLFWSPGHEDNPLHPGDDGKAAALMALVADLPVLPLPTARLGELIAGLSLCQRVICSDGGAMHLAAGLGKPILCFFGNSDAGRWHPWGVPFELLQPASRDVADLDLADVRAGWRRLEAQLRGEAHAL